MNQTLDKSRTVFVKENQQKQKEKRGEAVLLLEKAEV